MDSLLESALNAAALRPMCDKHSDRFATSQIYGGGPWQCMECTAATIAFTARGRAFGTGCGPEAHAEANGTQDSIHHNDAKHAQAFPVGEYTIISGGKQK